MSSLSTSLYGASVNKGVGGLLSGLDTDDLVKQMTATTRNRINRQYQAKQKLSYRQEAYREISKKLLTFSDKYLSYATGSKTNILSSSFFESNTYKSSSPYVNVTGDAKAIKNFEINSITSVATAANVNIKTTFTADNMNKPINTIVGLEDLKSQNIIVNNKEIYIDVTTSINDIMKKINNESDVNITYSSTLESFIMNSKETGAASIVDIKADPKNLVESQNILSKLFGGDVYAKNGIDTVMNVNLYGVPVDITRSTANFSIDGINVELGKNAATAVGAPAITFDVTNNSDEVVERVKQFIDDYNEIITVLGSKTKEKPNRSYAPLTPEQQDDMEKEEIENWNKEAKKGVLFGDSNMTTLLSDLRISLTGKTDVSDSVLSNFGISSASMDTSGKLVLDVDKFKSRLLENPDELASLFTGVASEGEKSGIAVQVRDIIRENIGAFGTSGKLIDEAGIEGSRTTDQNNISLKMKEHDDKMSELKKKLEAERKRYWDQFSALEQSLNKLNAQSSWLTDMMG